MGSQRPPASKHQTWSSDPRDPTKSERRIPNQILNFGFFMILIPNYRSTFRKSFADHTSSDYSIP
jgi:hypothetical protein